MFIISGCNGSGKTTASYTLLPELLDCSEFVNSDEFAKSLSPFKPECAYIMASRHMLRKVQYLFNRREDFCIETTLATRSLLKMVRSAQKQGYFVTVLYLWLRNPDIAVQRVAAQVSAGGHNIPEETIRRRYQVGLNYLFHDYMPTCDKWILADNSEPPFRLIAEGSRKGIVIHEADLYRSIQDLVSTPPVLPQGRIKQVAQNVAREIATLPPAHDGVPAPVIGSHETPEP